MRKTIAAAAVAASVAVGGITGAVLGTPGLAGAADTATGAVGWVQEALGGLVDDGTITQEQAAAVETALGDARQERGTGRGLGHHLGLSAVAEALGVSEDELRTALQDGRTIAEVAADEGVEVQAVVDAVVAAQREHLDEKLADGDLTQEQADELLAGADERVTAMTEDEWSSFRGGPGGRHRHRSGPPSEDEGDAAA
jgi:hypothetical protein